MPFFDFFATVGAFKRVRNIRGVAESEAIEIEARYSLRRCSRRQSSPSMRLRSASRCDARRAGRMAPVLLEAELQLDGVGLCLRSSIDEISSTITAAPCLC